MKRTAAQLADALTAALPALTYYDEHEGAPEALKQTRAALRAYDRAKKQPEQPGPAELARALRAILKELNGPMRGYWTESMDNHEQAARAVLAAFDRAQRPKPKGAPGLCPVCRHYGEDCTCYRRKETRHVRG